MAERRMFTKKVTDDDNFMSLSSSAQALYLHLSMSADDDGFCNQVSASMFKAHASVQDLQALLEKRYIYQFDSGVIVIKHWRMANALRKDRYTPTAFQEELAKLDLKDNGSYTWLPSGCQVVAERLPQVSIDKDSIDKDSIIPPLPPIGEQTKYDFDKHTNLVNYQHIKDTMRDEYIDYIVNHTELDECVTTWMKYKDERKPKSSNHYAETGLIQLLNKIYKQCLNHGINNVLNIIEESMSNNYQGIIWNQIKTQNNSQTSVFDAWAKA